MVQVEELVDVGEIIPSANLSQILENALTARGLDLEPFNVLVITQKIVSKAKGRLVDLLTVDPGAEAQRLAVITRKDPRLVELVLRESASVLRAVPHVLITRHRSGHVMADAGIDRSNLGPQAGEWALLLPENADTSAQRLMYAL